MHAYIVGEHGDTEFPLWSHATIGTVPILEWQPLDGQPRFTKEELDQIAVDVRDAAYKVIQGKGATNYAIGLSGARIVEAMTALIIGLNVRHKCPEGLGIRFTGI